MRAPTPLSAGLCVGLLTGIADSLIVYDRWRLEDLGVGDVPSFTWAAILWTWMTICALAALLPLGRLRGAAIVLAGPGLLLLARGPGYARTALELSKPATLALLLGIVLTFSLLATLVRFREQRHARRYFAAALLSVGALLFSAADISIEDEILRASPRSTQRNVVLVFLDTVRRDDMESMPALSAFAKRSLSFDNAWAPASWTIPSHYAVLTGTDPWSLSYDAKMRRFERATLLSEHFKNRGYETAAIFANSALSPEATFAHGFDEFTYSRASRVCRSAPASFANRVWRRNGPRAPLCALMRASDVTSRAQAFIDRAERPFFLALNYFDAHTPYYVPHGCRDDSFKPIPWREQHTVAVPWPSSPLDPKTVARVRGQYRAALRCLDRSLGDLIAQLEHAPNTVIAFVGDHGEQFGEHGLGTHQNSVYRQVLHVPLIVNAPGVATGTFDDPVSITDLHRSLIELAGRGTFPLLDARRRRPVLASFASENGSAFSAVEGNHHLIRWSDGREELFDYRSDPAENHPLHVSEAAGRLRSMISSVQNGRSDFRALGYLHN